MTRLFEIAVWWLFYSEMLPGDCPAARIFAIKHEENAKHAPKGAGEDHKTQVRRILLRFMRVFTCFLQIVRQGSSGGGIRGEVNLPPTRRF